MRKALFYSATLIGTYLIVANATGFGRALTAAGGFVRTSVKTFQGR